MSAGDHHIGIAAHTALEIVELGGELAAGTSVVGGIGVVARAATEDVAEEGVAVAGVVGGCGVAGFIGIAIIGEVVLGGSTVDGGITAVFPVVALGHLARNGVDARGILGLDGCNGFGNFESSI